MYEQNDMNIMTYSLVLLLHTFFKIAGKHRQHISLPYIAERSNAVCCSGDYIFMAGQDPAGVHIHTWTGLHIQSLMQYDVGLERNDRIHALQCSANGSILQLAVHGFRRESLLNAYKVNCTSLIPHYEKLIYPASLSLWVSFQP